MTLFEEQVLVELRAIRAALEADEDEDEEERCLECGNDELEDTTEMGGKPRVTCLGEQGCGKSFYIERGF